MIGFYVYKSTHKGYILPSKKGYKLMFIKRIHLQNYRNFSDFTMEFHKGLNVIIGANNSGKTGLLYAIKLLCSPGEISINDFNKNNLQSFTTDYVESAPSILIEYDISHEIFEDDTDDESIVRLLPFLGIKEFASTRQEENGRIKYAIAARVRAVFALDPKCLGDYKTEVSRVTDFESYLAVLERFVEKHYAWTYTNGLSDTKADQKDVTGIFDLRFIGAERTSEEVRKETKKEIEKFTKDPAQAITLDEFRRKTSEELEVILKPTITKLADLFETEDNEIGLKKGHVAIASVVRANLDASNAYLTEVKDTKGGFRIPLDHNGLGYNNLINIYMLIKLTEIKKGRDFRVLCLEEPEAHLHPAMQYKLFKYLRNLDKEDKLNQQVFVTTHSSNISAVAGLDNMFMLAYDRTTIPPDCKQQSLEKQFIHSCAEGDVSGKQLQARKLAAKRHLSKFLDVTRSDMLFADKVILVEGIAEKLLMPAFMDKCGIPYEDEHISIVEVGGKLSEYFIELYNGNRVSKKVLCITDNDFDWIEDGKLCGIEEYRSYEAPHIRKLKNYFSLDGLKIVTQTGCGRTFEDELLLSCFEDVSLAACLFKMVTCDSLQSFVDRHGMDLAVWESCKGEIDGRVLKTVGKYLNAFADRNEQTEENKDTYKKIAMAELFLHYAKNQKGDLALGILTNEAFFDENGKLSIPVPNYIREGLEWLRN